MSKSPHQDMPKDQNYGSPNHNHDQTQGQIPSIRNFNDHGVQSQIIIPLDSLIEDEPVKLNKSSSKFKIIACTIIAILITLLLVSIFFIFAVPHIAFFRDIMKIQLTDITDRFDDIKRAQKVAPLPNLQTEPKSVSSVQNLPSYAKWNYWPEPLWLPEFTYSVADQLVFSFEKIVPKQWNATQMRITVFFRSLNEKKHEELWTRIRLVNGQDEYRQWIRSTVFPRDSLTTSEETFIVPIGKTREIRMQSNYIKSNWCYANIAIQGWR